MDKYLSKIKIQFIFFFFSLLISSMICKDMHKDNIYDNKNEDEIFPDEIQDITTHKFQPGKVYNINLYRLNIARIIISKKENEKYKVHFYPLECNIHIADSEEYQTINISNYNYDAFYSLSKNENKKIKFYVKPLIYSLSGELKNISCPLIINSVLIHDNENPPELELNEKDPTLFHFNDDMPSLKLIYYYNNNGNPIIVSFFNKEKARFRIECNDGEEKINKIIYYKETILIKPNSQNTKYNILVTRIDQVNSTMIIKISGNITSPFYLQKNILNLGFIPKNEICQYYYMKVYKRQEGEITLNNKRLNGLLISKIIYKDETENISNITLFPECNKAKLSNEYLQFDEYNKKMSFNSTSTKNCEDNCYLLVTYYSELPNFLNITGNEYTLLARVWDEEDFISQIVNIPLNEFIFGVIDNTTINIHYYSVYIPDDTEDITIEIHGENIISYAKKGIKKINTFKITNNTKILNKNLKEKIIINLNCKELDLNSSYKGQYISFAFKKEDDDIQFSYYYFRILQSDNNNNNITMYPLDTNKDMLCQTKSINGNNTCYFLLKNDYKELLNKFIFYGSGQKNIDYQIYCLNISDDNSFHYKLNNNNKKEYEYIKYKGGCEDSMFAVIKINSNFIENITFESNFCEIDELEQKFDIYSYQLFYLNKSTNISFESNQNILYKYRVFVNNIGGLGNLIFKYSNGKEDNLIFEGKKTYSFSINNEINNIYFTREKSLVFNIKINYQMKYEFMNELDYEYNKIDIANKANKGTFPLIYYIKDIKYGGMDINLYFKMNNDNVYNNDFIIKGGVIDYKDFKEIESEKDVEKYLHSLIDGIYEPEKYSGLIVFDKELNEENKGNDKKHDDEYSFIIIDKKNKTNNNISNFTLEINVIPKNDNTTFLMINKYTQSSFKLLNNISEFPNYYIDNDVIDDNKFYIELSSNYENTYLEFYNEKNILGEKNIGGVKQYLLLISNETDDNNFFFTVKVNRSGIIKDPKFRVTYSLIFYLEEKKFDVENIIKKEYSYKFNDIKENLKGKVHLTIKNKNQENKNKNSNITYYYYLRYINKNYIIENENLNTISPIFSDLNSINITNASDTNQEISYSFDCNIEQNYLGSLLIKIVNGTEKEKYERYYSIPINFSTNETFIEKNKIVILIIASLSIIIIFGFIFFCVIWRRIKRKNINLEDKVKAISFSEGIEEDSSSQNLQNKSDDEYENTFI